MGKGAGARVEGRMTSTGTGVALVHRRELVTIPLTTSDDFNSLFGDTSLFVAKLLCELLTKYSRLSVCLLHVRPHSS